MALAVRELPVLQGQGEILQKSSCSDSVSSVFSRKRIVSEVFAMIVTAWNNGTPSSTGAGYGVKLKAFDRDRHFRREWDTIELELEGFAHVIKVNVAKASFWNSSCRELIHSEIGRWLIDKGLHSWQLGKPPKLSLRYIGGNRFRLTK
jgi:hypothetical protein